MDAHSVNESIEPLRIASSSREPTVPRQIIGQPVQIVAVGDLAAFETGRQGARVTFLDKSVGCEGGRPFGNFYIDQFDNQPEAKRQARSVSREPVLLIRYERDILETNRGQIHLDSINYSDGGQSPRMPDDALAAIRNELIRSLAIGVKLD